MDDIQSRSQRNREPVYKCSKYSSELSRVFEINIVNYLDTVHPSNFCKPCHIVVHTYMKALNEGKVYKYSKVLFSGWGPHLEDRCSTCEYVKSLQFDGRPKKKAGSGRPSIKDINTLQKQKRDYHSPERVIVALDIALAITSDSHPTLPRVLVTPY